MKIKGIIFSLLSVFLSYAQINESLLNNDFLVSSDNYPSTIKQESVSLFPDPNGGGIYIWYDYRKGELSYFAQKVDSLGNKVGQNFEVSSDYDLCFAPDGSFLILNKLSSSYNSPYMWDGYYSIDGKIYLDENTAFPSFYITGGSIPWCATGWLGIHNSLIRTQNHYLNFHSSGGYVSLTKIEFNGNLVFQSTPDDSLPTNAYAVASAANQLNEYALFSLQGSWESYDGKLFGTFFSASDSIIANQVLIDSTIIFDNYDFNSSFLKSIALPDTTYQVFYISRDSLLLNSWKVNRDGSVVQMLPDLKLFKSDLAAVNLNRYIKNFAITPIIDNKFSLLISINESRYPEDKEFHSLYTFNGNGELAESFFDSSLTLSLRNNFQRTQDGNLLVPTAINYDAYQLELHNLTVIDSLKLNDDLAGSNELSPIVHEINNDELLISYTDEQNILCKKIDSDGNILSGAEKVIENRRINFFSDGWSVGIWSEENPVSHEKQDGYSIYDQDFQTINKIYLNTSQQGSPNISCKIVSDSVFLVVFYVNKQLIARLYNRNGEIKREQLLLSASLEYPISIFKENQNSFLISTYQYAQFLDNNLDSTSTRYGTYVDRYLGNSKLLSITSNEYSPLTGQILDLNGNALTNKFYLANSYSDLYVNKLNDNYFAVVFKVNEKLFVKCYSMDGKRIGDSIMIHSNVQGLRKNPNFTVVNNKVVFVWSDARNIANGYDIYCSIFNLSDLTDIEIKNNLMAVTEFQLSQNYPNPFNPSTKIRYSVSCVGARCIVPVQLMIYDVIGNEVATLIDEYKPAGSYEVEFDASKLTSGVYFYTLKAGDYHSYRKMLLLK
ncbi:MAG: hypothetical protein HXY50_02835 [Ignavibacteriaceae bacterium]|nr:hypothetical protein [Ignavibacteriaceae bacterium]